MERLDGRRIRLCGDNETVGHRETSSHQLSEVGRLAPGGRNVVPAEITQRRDGLHAVTLPYRVGPALSRRSAPELRLGLPS